MSQVVSFPSGPGALTSGGGSGHNPDILTCLANLTGNPVVTLPNPRSSATPPSSLQLMGKLGSDAELFEFAGRINMDLQ